MNTVASFFENENSATIVANVYKTKDYSLFKSIDGNRDVNPLHVKRLKDSFNKKYLINPIIVNKRYEIIDGQHRFNAAKALGLDVVFIICPDYEISDVQLLNTHARNWGKMDYLDAYCKTGKQAYIELRKFMEDFPLFGISAAEVLVTQNLGGKRNYDSKLMKQEGLSGGGFAVKYFEEGDLAIPNLDYSYECAQKIMQVGEYYNGFNRAVFVRAMIGIFRIEQYDHNQFIARLKANPNALDHCATVMQYKEMIEDIYNFRSRNKISLRF